MFWFGVLAQVFRLTIASRYAEFRAKEGSYVADRLQTFTSGVRRRGLAQAAGATAVGARAARTAGCPCRRGYGLPVSMRLLGGVALAGEVANVPRWHVVTIQLS